MRKLISIVTPYLLIIALTLFGLHTLISNAYYTSHDGILHLARIAAYSASLGDGQFPPRWATNLNGAMGSPIFVYIYPLPYLLGALTHLLGMSFTASYQFWMIFSTLASTVAMYLWLKISYGKVPSIVGAIAYIWAPYRFLNLYVRAAYAESLAFAFPPLCFLFLEKLLLAKSKKLLWAGLTLSIAALLLTHTQIAAFTLPLLLVYTFIKAYNLKNRESILIVLAGIVTAFLLASFIYIPDFFERHLINFDNGFNFYQDHFVAPWQLLSSPWGFGFDFPGSDGDSMSFKIGQTQIFSALLTLGIVFFTRVIKKSKKNLAVPVFFLLVWVLAVSLMVQTSMVKIVWETLPLIKTIVDYPWRLFFLVVFSSSVLLAYGLSKIKYSLILAPLLIIFLVLSNRNHININLPQEVSDAEVNAYWGSGTASSNEYKPRVHTNDTIVERKSPVDAITEGIVITESKQTASEVNFTVVATQAGIVRINRFNFPKTILTKNDTLLTENVDYMMVVPVKGGVLNDTGLLEVNITPPGGTYRLIFRDTLLRQLGNLISLGTFVFVCGILAYGFKDYLRDRSK